MPVSTERAAALLSFRYPSSIIITITILNNLTITILSLFTLGSIYSTSASVAKQVTETNNSNQTINRVKNPQLAGGKPAGYLQAWSRI